ncbi:MAG: hypothetical protein LQ349_002109 [Xanthoria aureola]|nr:MAG: hypothetical protein LQ349_002109 [Xanthoria aureola]
MPDQPKALKWLYEAAKLHFFADYEALLASWGLTLQHKGTCLLVPEAWRFSNPLHLMALFSIDSVPPPDSPRAWYSYADHATSLARAKVFFEKVQRKGEDLDIFLGYPDLPAMDASHLCHQEYCVIHLVYELAHINQDRNNCLKRAKFLRSQNMPIPEGCTAHNPSPMHDADFTCTYCTPHFQTFASIIGLWSHIVNRHQDVDNSVRLEKIKQTAAVWSEYWRCFSKGGKRNYPTLSKVNEAQEESFSWTDVMKWRLRWA